MFEKSERNATPITGGAAAGSPAGSSGDQTGDDAKAGKEV